MKAFAIAFGIVGCVAAISYSVAIYNIEESKDQAFMMKACVDAGGQWDRSGWSVIMTCTRPKAIPRS